MTPPLGDFGTTKLPKSSSGTALGNVGTKIRVALIRSCGEHETYGDEKSTAQPYDRVSRICETQGSAVHGRLGSLTGGQKRLNSCSSGSTEAYGYRLFKPVMSLNIYGCISVQLSSMAQVGKKKGRYAINTRRLSLLGLQVFILFRID